MNVAQTSIEAYKHHVESGAVSKQASYILQSMLPDADYSRRELAKLTSLDLSSVCGRVNELIKIGLLTEGETRLCKVTNKKIHPVKLPK